MLEKMTRHASPAQLKTLVDLVPPEHRKFIRTLRGVVDEDDFFILHAMWPLAMPAEDPKVSFRLTGDAELRSQTLWGRYDYPALAAEKPWKRTGYFGHTPVQSYRHDYHEPLRGPDIVLLDTGAALTVPARTTRSGSYATRDQTRLSVHINGKAVVAVDVKHVEGGKTDDER